MIHPLVPLHLSLAGRPVVVIGGGPVARRKVTTALDGGAVVTVVAPDVCDDLADSVAAGEVSWAQREYLAGDLAGAWLAFAATGDADTDRAVEQEAVELRVFCVRSSAPDDPAGHPGTRSPAVLRRGAVTVGVSTNGGADPRRAVAIRDAIGWVMDSGRLPLLAEADSVVVDRPVPREVLDELGPTALVCNHSRHRSGHADQPG